MHFRARHLSYPTVATMSKDDPSFERVLQTLRCSQIEWPGQDAVSNIAALRALGPSPAQTIELDGYDIVISLTAEPQGAMAQLERAQDLLRRAQLQDDRLIEAGVWRTLHLIQGLLLLHSAALHSVGMAHAIYLAHGRHDLAQILLTARTMVLFQAELYEDLLQASKDALAQHADLPPYIAQRLHSSAAGAYFQLALQAKEDAERLTLMNESLSAHRQALAISKAHGLEVAAMVSTLNIAVVLSWLGDTEGSKAMWRIVDAGKANTPNRPGWADWVMLGQALVAAQEDGHGAGWQQLLMANQQLAPQALNRNSARFTALHAIRLMGPRFGHMQDALEASDTLLRKTAESKRLLGSTLQSTVDAFLERPGLLTRNENLAQKGMALESSLALRNAELSSALAKLQAEVSVRQAAEAALQKAHDELEDQVQQRTTQLEQAMRTLMQQEKQLALSRMVAGMAHELNTPLGNARMAASAMTAQAQQLREELALGTLRRSALHELLSAMTDGGQLMDRALDRASDLVQRFKSLVHTSAEEPCSDFDLVELLSSAQKAWQPLMLQHSATWRIDAPAELCVSGRPNAIRQCLQQLLENSLQHGFKGRQHGEISVQLLREGGDVVLRWHDNGCGITAEKLPHVFEPFFTSQLGQSGTGLGLASVHSVVMELMQGHISVDSQPGAGTTVLIRLPMKVASRQLTA